MNDPEKAIKVAIITLASIEDHGFRKDFIAKFGNENLSQLLEDTEPFIKENIEDILFDALNSKELDEIKSNWLDEQLRHADTLVRLNNLQEAVSGFLSNTGNVIENKWLQDLREALPKSMEK